ncbi:MAG: PilZ domain-containing protein [Desulfobulbus sp.]|nr:PilZ domain-containing protein [Desulfobulbus sp.]
MKKLWEDIPSLEGLSVEWDYAPESARDQRMHVRLAMPVVGKLIDVAEIVVKMATSKATYEGRLIDISEGGLAIRLPVALATDLPVKVGLILGQTKIIARAQVRHVQAEEGGFVTGLQFVGLSAENAQYISGLYAAKVLSRVT